MSMHIAGVFQEDYTDSSGSGVDQRPSVLRDALSIAKPSYDDAEDERNIALRQDRHEVIFNNEYTNISRWSIIGEL